MTIRISIALVAAVAAGVALSTPSRAAMPAGPAAVAASDDGLVIQVAKRKRMPKRETRQQELDRSIDQGTVPSRYRRNVPQEYQQYIPFERR